MYREINKELPVPNYENKPLVLPKTPRLVENITDETIREMRKTREQLTVISEELRRIRENGLRVYSID